MLHFRTILFSLITLCCLSATTGQNLVPNYNFGKNSGCPNGLGAFNALQWQSASLGTPDYFHLCSTSGDSAIPFNYYGVNFSFNGSAYIGLITKKLKEENYREYAQAELIDTTVEGCYEFKMWINAADETAFGDRLGVFLTDYAFFNPFVPIVYAEPQIEITEPITQTSDWYEYSTELWLPSGLSHITLGNFRHDSITDAKGGAGSLAGELSMVYIDAVSLVHLSEEPNVDVDLGPDLDICPQDYPLVLNSGVVNGDYLWSTGEKTATIQVNTPGIYTVTAFDNCVSKSDTIFINTIPIPNFNLAPEYDICSGDTLFIDLNPAYGNYIWQDGSNSIHYPILNPGTYTTTLTHPCGSIIDSFSVQLLEQPVIEPIDDVSVCQNDLPYIVDLDYLNTGYNDFYWSNGFTQDYNAIVSGGNFGVTVSNNCFLDTASFEVEVNQNLPYYIPFDDTLVCEDQYFIILTTNKGNSYLWDNGETTEWVLAHGPGIYSVTISNACDTSVYNFEAKEYPAPVFSLGEDVFICEGDMVTLMPNADFEDLDVSFSWSTGQTGDSITVDQAGTYWLSVTGECESYVDSIEIAYSGVDPVISFPADITICEGASAKIKPETGGLVYQYIWSTGSTDKEINVQTEGWYFITATNNCGTANDSIYVTVDGLIPVLAIPETAEICEGDSYFYSLPANDYTLLWSTGETGDQIELSTSGIYWLKAENDCGITYDTIQLNVIPDIPKPEMGIDMMLCQGNSLSLGVNDIGTEILWSTGATGDSIVINSPGSYWVNYSNACFSYFDTIIISDAGVAPLIDLGNDVLLCEGDSILLDLSAPDTDTVLWSTGSNEFQEWLSEAGIYTVTAGNGCGESMDTIEVSTYTDVPVIDLGSDTGLCQGDSITLDLGNIPGNIMWNTGSVANSIVVSSPGIYYVNVSSNCGESTDTIEIMDSGIMPAFDLGVDAYICPGDNVEFSIDPGLGNISWNFGGNQSTITVDEEGIFIATVSNACGVASDTVQVFVNNGPPVVDLGADQIICEGDSIILGVNPGNGAVSWSNGSTDNNIIVTQEGQYSVMVSTNCGESNDAVLVSFDNPPPVFDLGPDIFICPGDTVELLADNTLGNIEWQDGTIGTIYEVTSAGIISVSIENNCGTGYDSLEVFENPLPSVVDLGPDQSICLGDSLWLQVNPATGSINWPDGSQNDSFLITQAGEYSVQISTICAISSDTIIVDWSDAIPELDLGDDLTICEGDSIYLDSGLGNALTYEWNTTESTSGIYLQNEGVYWLQISNSCGSETDSVELFFEAELPVWTLGADTILCAGDPLTLNTGLDPDMYQFNWNTGSQDASITIQSEGNYWMALSNACETSADTIQIQYFEPVEPVSLGPDLVICEGDSIILDAFQQADYTYIWNNNWNLADILILEEGLYSITVSNQCESRSDDIQIIFNDEAFQFNDPTDIIACENDPIQLNVAQDFEVNYNWADGGNSPYFNTSDAGLFEVSLSAECIDTTIAFIVERKYCDDGRMFVPNIFSPNGDGVNDYFSIGYYNSFSVSKFEVHIFDRWGNQVYLSEDPLFQWDGTASGEVLMPGVYIYYFTLLYQTEEGEKQISTSGDITLLR